MSGRAATTTIIPGRYAISVGKTDMTAPPGWNWMLLTDIARLETGHTPSRNHPEYWEGGDIPWIGIKDARLHHGRAIFSTLQKATQLGINNSAARLLPMGTVCLSRTASVGYVLVMAREMATSQDFVNWVCSAAIVPEFLMYALMAEGDDIRRFGKGTTHTTIYFPEVKAFHVCVPPINEQRRIVAKIEELFSDLEAGVAALKRAKANLKRYRASVLKAAVEGKLTEDWRKKNKSVEPATKLLERILTERRKKWEADQLARFKSAGKEPPKGWKEKYKAPSSPDLTDVPEIPEGWTICSVDQISAIITSGSRDWSQYYGDGTGTFIMAQNVRSGKFDLTFRQSVNPPINDRDRVRSQVADGDLLVTIVGANTGDVCRVDGDFPEHYVCQSVALVRLVNPAISPFLESYFVSHENGQRQFRRYIYGQGRPHLGFDQLRITLILLPSIEEQNQIVAEVSEKLSLIDSAETAIDHGLKRAARLRQSILKQAFEGKLVPQDPADEPASVLLERIKAGRHTRDGESRTRTKATKE